MTQKRNGHGAVYLALRTGMYRVFKKLFLRSVKKFVQNEKKYASLTPAKTVSVRNDHC